MSEGRVCMVVQEYPPHVGGLAVAGRRVAEHLVSGGFCVHVVVPGAEETVESVEGGVVVHRVKTGADRMAAFMELARAVRRLDGEVGFDLFHGFFLPSVPSCIGAARRLKEGQRRPVIASVRGTDATTLLRQPMLRPMLLAGLGEAAWVTSVNQAYLEDLAQQVDLTGRSSVVRNGASAVPATWRLTDANRGVVGTSGKFRQVKDIPLLVRGFAASGAGRLLLVGDFADAGEGAWSRRLMEEFGLESRVEMTGYLGHGDALAQLGRMHVYVQSSAFEGMPNALLEAASAGVPVVATAVGGIAEVFTDGVDALLVRHGDPAALGAAIARVVGEDGLAERLSANGRKLCGVYSHERERREWVQLHRRLIAEARA